MRSWHIVATDRRGRMFEVDVGATNCPDWYAVLQCQGIEWSEIEFVSVASADYLAAVTQAVETDLLERIARDAADKSAGADPGREAGQGPPAARPDP
jgi:hypothetical protein